MATTYLSVVHLATAGLNGPLLGSDEEEIVFICLVVVNIQTNQVNIYNYYYSIVFLLCVFYFWTLSL